MVGPPAFLFWRAADNLEYMSFWFPQTPSDFMLVYASVIALALLLFMRRRPGKTMLLRLRGGQHGEKPALTASQGSTGVSAFTHVQPRGERPLNVMFNYNGHSWDAYEVLGLPAGSSLEKVADALALALKNTDSSSHGFLEAAHRAIRAEWDAYRQEA